MANALQSLRDHQLAGIQQQHIPIHAIPDNDHYKDAMAASGGYLAKNVLHPEASEYSVVQLLNDPNGGGMSGKVGGGFHVSDWSLKHMDKMLLQEHRKIQMIEDPLSGRKKRFAEYYGVRNKYIEEMEKVKQTLVKELLLTPEEGYTMAWEYLKPQFDLDMKLIRQKYPEVESYTEKVVGGGYNESKGGPPRAVYQAPSPS